MLQLKARIGQFVKLIESKLFEVPVDKTSTRKEIKSRSSIIGNTQIQKAKENYLYLKMETRGKERERVRVPKRISVKIEYTHLRVRNMHDKLNYIECWTVKWNFKMKKMCLVKSIYESHYVKRASDFIFTQSRNIYEMSQFPVIKIPSCYIWECEKGSITPRWQILVYWINFCIFHLLFPQILDTWELRLMLDQ